MHSCFYVKGGLGGSISETLLWLCSRGWIGVPMFFVISGYCISATADSNRRKQKPAGQYFVRRLRRIFPPYWFALLFTVIAVALTERYFCPGLFADEIHPLEVPSARTPLEWFGNITLTEGWRWHFTPGEHAWYLLQAWTLGYEEQFYIAMGVMLLLFRRRFFLTAATLTAGQIVLNWIARPVGFSDQIRGFFFDPYWEMFAAGIGVYCVVNYWRGWQTAAAYFATIGLIGIHTWQYSLHDKEALVAWSFVLIILILHRFDHRIAASRMAKPFAVCGSMCYSLYLVHWPVVKGISHALYLNGLTEPTETVLVTIPACAIATLAVGWLFHLGIERHFLNVPQVTANEQVLIEAEQNPASVPVQA